VRDGGRLVAAIDARTFAVSEPGAAAATRPAPPATPRRSVSAPADAGGFPWLALLLAGGAACLCAVVVALARRRGKASSPAHQR
jgi:hypothetical protein